MFLRLGSTAFGGPAAHIAMMHEEVVRRRSWLSEARFLDLLSATNLIPGPNSTELAIHIGWERRRWAGLAVAGVAFIVPAMLLTSVLGWAYLRFGSLPSAQWLLYGVKPVMLAVIAQALWRLAPSAGKSRRLQLLGVLAGLAATLGVNELVVLFTTGLLALLLARFLDSRPGTEARFGTALLPIVPVTTSAVTASVKLSSLFFVFLKIGSILFGSGYVLLAFLKADLVDRLGWLSQPQLMDAIAVGQVTPGPVFTTATFIGYVLAGPRGALVATAGIFLPAFAFVAASGPLIPRLRASKSAGAFLDGLNVASLALMVVVSVELARSSVVDLPTAVLAGVSALLLIRRGISSFVLIVGGAAAGYLLHALRL